MKHFLATAYMVFCVFMLKAQDREPLLYYMRADGTDLIEANLRDTVYSDRITDLPPMWGEFEHWQNNSDFDAFNGRYFYKTYSYYRDSFGSGVRNFECIYIVEVDIAAKTYKMYKTPYNRFYDLHYLFYDPFSNSLILSSASDTLRSLSLENGKIETIGYLQVPANYQLNTGRLYRWRDGELLFSATDTSKSAKPEMESFYLLDINKNQLTYAFDSKRQDWRFMKYNYENDDYYGFGFEYAPPSNAYLYKLSRTGNIDTIKNLRNWVVYWDRAIYLCTYNKAIYFTDLYYRLIKMPIDNQPDEETVSFILSDNPQLHTFNHPYIQISENGFNSTYGKSYRWFWNNKPIENSNTQTYAPTQCGDYKVIVTHLDGRIDTSQTVHFEVKDAQAKTITGTFSTVYPNPFRKSTSVHYKTCSDNIVCIEIYDLQGRKILFHQTEKLSAGEYNYDWNAETGLRYGLYFIKVFSGSELISTQKVLKL